MSKTSSCVCRLGLVFACCWHGCSDEPSAVLGGEAAAGASSVPGFVDAGSERGGAAAPRTARLGPQRDDPSVGSTSAAAMPMAGAQDQDASMGGAGAAGAVASRGAAGASGDATAVVMPVERDGMYVLAFDDVTFEIDPQRGGRIRTFALAGQNVLTGPDVDADNWGSTFWPSPQQRWNWPPVPELDSQPYAASIEGDAVVLTSAAGVRAQVRVSKRVRADATRRAIEIEYTLENTDSAPAQWAPWEISRVAPSGITFFPTGSAEVATELPVTQQDPITWYAHDPSTLPAAGQKYSADGSGGWLAHVAGRLLFVKTFPDVAPQMQAPAPEAEIEIYACPSYVELEPQGAYTQLAPGEALHWTVRWYLRALPPELHPGLGDPQLVALAQAIAEQ